MNVSDTFWTKKYRRHIAAMIGVCYRYVPDRETAEDLAHDAFLRAMEKTDTLRLTESFEYWLTRITVNIVMTYLRERGRMTFVDMEWIPDEPNESDGDLPPETMFESIRQADFTREEILEAIAQLPEHHRTVFNLYVFEKLTHNQIAEKLGVSANTSKSHLMRARKELQIILFNKTKRKNRPLMTLILPFFGVDAAFDRYCRGQMAGLAMPPQRPLSASDIHGAATAKLPVRMRLHAFRAPLAAGVGTAAVGAMLVPAILQPSQPADPETPQPTPVVSTVSPFDDNTDIPSTDSAATIDVTEISSESTVHQPVKKMPTQEVPAKEETALSTETLTDTATAAPPVVVKKVVRHSNRTVVIKDSNNR